MKTLLKLATAATLLTSVSAFAAVSNGAHNFSDNGYLNNDTQVCVYCHTPHNANPVGTGGPLWNRASSTATYSYYTSATINVSQGIGAESKACLGCHDGTIAIDSVVNAPGTATWAGTNKLASGNYAFIGSDLSNDHPVGFAYTDAAVGPGMVAAATVTADADLSFFGGSSNQMECATCHDVHGEAAGLLRKANTGSALCTTCHSK